MHKIVTIGSATLYLGDCREILPSMKADAILTDPPYLEGDQSDVLPLMLAASSRVAVTPGKMESFNWIRRQAPDWEYTWKCSGTRTTGGAWCLHILTEPLLSYGWPKRPLGSDLLDFPLVVDADADGHPWPKPLPLLEKLVAHWSDEGDTVLDCWMGAGTTGKASVMGNRKFIGIELNPRFFDIACRRIENAQRQERLFA